MLAPTGFWLLLSQRFVLAQWSCAEPPPLLSCLLPTPLPTRSLTGDGRSPSSPSNGLLSLRSCGPIPPPLGRRPCCGSFSSKGIWTGEKARKAGKGNGLCPRCKRVLEDLPHLFLHCPFNRPIWAPFVKALGSPLTWQQVLLGDRKLHTLAWNHVRAEFMWLIWRQRNGCLFEGAFQISSLRVFFYDVHLHAQRISKKECRIYRLKAKMLESIAQHYDWLTLDEGRREWINEIAFDLEEAEEDLERAKELLEAIQVEIDILPE
ncbi:hypothetical protein GOP47_0028779 [Adiantum capillus-veneris]|nr:hypothetical protein GOP47_0028779 [Adiantum capillus-veneris]